MFIRVRAVLVIFFTTLVIISFSVLVGIITIRSGIEMSQEADLMMLADIGDDFISSEIRALRQGVSGAALLLSVIDDGLWPEALDELESRHPEVIGMAVWDDKRELIAAKGLSPAASDALDDRYVQQAFQGKTALSTTVASKDGLVFYAASPLLGGDNRILVFTIPGTFFSDLLSSFVIWETGHIFMDDAGGSLIANPRPSWVEERVDFVEMASIDSSNLQLVRDIRQGEDTEARMIRYSIFDVPRLCVYRPVSGSEGNWFMGVVAPVHESPFGGVDRGLVLVGAVSLVLSLIAAIIASGFIKKPFMQIAALKEEAEAISGYKSDFLANMSHEIRTPINAIMGVAEILMRDEDVPANIGDGLGRIHSSGELLLNIINDILDLSKIEAGKLDLAPADYETASLINDTVTLNMMRLGSKEIEFSLYVDENIPNILFGDEIRIKQILNNLLSNAFKYTDKGEVRLSFAVVAGASGGAGGETTLVVCVGDSGQGMTAEQVDSVFEQYSRFNYEANRTIEGTGLGLNITQNLLRLMNGEIAVESTPGKGSVFTVRLPQGVSGGEVLGSDLAQQLMNFRLNGAKRIKKANIAYETMPYGRVLVVDDVESNLYVAKGLLLPYELSVDVVASGFGAIDRIKAGNVYDIVFMDHMMPKMDGVEATKIIRGLGYAHPIVALTANAVKGQQEMFLSNGFDDFVSKPIDIRQLNSVLKKFIRDKQPPEVLRDACLRAGGSGGDGLPGGNMEQEPVTQNIVESFVRDAVRAADVLDSTLKKDGAFDEEDIRAYTISVHSMKSALAIVGQSELSGFAARLEQAGLNTETAVIAGETPKFLNELRMLIEMLAPMEEPGAGGGEAADCDYRLLRGELIAIKEACGAYDRKAAKDAIFGLRQKSLPAPVSSLLGVMHDQLLSGDFEEVSSSADKIMEML